MSLSKCAFFVAVCLGSSAGLGSAETPYRTDGGDEKLPWYELQPGVFPPEGSAHYIAGELISMDHVNRKGLIRPDRTDAQRRGEWDVPIAFTMLPYGSLSYHGAPADLRDIPIGTHLHGQFYMGGDVDPNEKSSGKKKVAVDAAFTRVLKFEDDFSYNLRKQRVWRVDTVQEDIGQLTVTGMSTDGKTVDAKPTLFQIGGYTRVWKGRGIGGLADVVVGHPVIMNLTVCTLKGPGRVTDIWVDQESRDVASAHQKERHRQYQREHGLAGMIDEVDNEKGIVSVKLFAGFDPFLKTQFAINDVVNALVAEDSLRTWDQINDKKAGPLLEILEVPPGPGDSGVKFKFQPSMLLEGFRPGRIIRILSPQWKLDDLPREEKLYH